MAALFSSAGRLCTRLQAAGLLRRIPGPGDRLTRLRLTSQGATLLGQHHQQRQHQLARILDTMTPADRAALLARLTHFQSAARQQRRS